MHGGNHYSETSILDSLFDNKYKLEGGNKRMKISGSRKIKNIINLKKK